MFSISRNFFLIAFFIQNNDNNDIPYLLLRALPIVPNCRKGEGQIANFWKKISQVNLIIITE